MLVSVLQSKNNAYHREIYNLLTVNRCFASLRFFIFTYNDLTLRKKKTKNQKTVPQLDEQKRVKKDLPDEE